MADDEVPHVQFRDKENLLPDSTERISLLSDQSRIDPSKVRNGFLYVTTLIVLQGSLVMGLAIGYTSPAQPKMSGFMTDSQYTWFGSLLNVGAIVGGPLAGYLLQVAGRKVTIMASCVPFVAGWVLIGTSEIIMCLYAGRVLTGVGAGMISLAVPNYISEVATPNLRGFLGSSFQVSVTVGILLVYCIGIPLTYYWLALTGGAMAVLLAMTSTIIPETPRFLLIRHLRAEASYVLRKLRGPFIDVDIECREIEDALDNSDEKFSWIEFSQPTLYKPLVISLVLMFVQQFSGINAVMFYTVSIFQTAEPSMNPNIPTVIVGGVQVLFTCVAAVLMDRMGRKLLLIVGAIGMAVSAITFGLYYELTDIYPDQTDKFSPMSLVSIIVYIISFSLAWGPIPWLIMSEIFPSKAKGAASGIATAFNWTCSFIITKEFQDMEVTFTKQGIFWFFGGICLLGGVFVALVVPETKGRSLEEIEASFARNESQSR
ncbi:solute carrier family 2, facilitated glucose transporter member 8-like [Diadema setosum]|uniref:solute carrier family 2, facilitated glucose transporter member 8-like n=1 Tax=Diadema setosum TaxID=31175 RepID=UPI003B3B6B48